jgi:hypothetical protein
MTRIDAVHDIQRNLLALEKVALRKLQQMLGSTPVRQSNAMRDIAHRQTRRPQQLLNNTHPTLIRERLQTFDQLLSLHTSSQYHYSLIRANKRIVKMEELLSEGMGRVLA